MEVARYTNRTVMHYKYFYTLLMVTYLIQYIITNSIAGDSQAVRPRAEPSAALCHHRPGGGLQQQ